MSERLARVPDGRSVFDLTLRHYSAAPIKEPIRSTPQLDVEYYWPKPSGFWVSVDNHPDQLDEPMGWADWCRAEGYGLRALECQHDVALAPNARILLLTGARDIDAFTRTYGKTLSLHSRGNYIDWRKVAKKYQGIVIAPYIWSRRLHDSTGWYYGWDCSSGCIWDAAAIASVAPRTGGET